MATSSSTLCVGVSDPFRRFTDEVVNLKFDEEPAYAAYISIFQPLLGMCWCVCGVDSVCVCGTPLFPQTRPPYTPPSVHIPPPGTAPSRPIALVDAATPRVGQKRGRTDDPVSDDVDASANKKRIRLGFPATQWITIYNKMRPMKQRYHYNVSANRLEFHVNKGLADGLYISAVACCGDLWAVIMDAGTNHTAQTWTVEPEFLPKKWVMQQWDQGYYITTVAGASNGHSLVVMSKGPKYTQQSYKVSDMFPFEWIKKKWREGFQITSMATTKSQWAVVMSRCQTYVEQCVELDFQYPSEGIHRRWDLGRVLCVCVCGVGGMGCTFLGGVGGRKNKHHYVHDCV